MNTLSAKIAGIAGKPPPGSKLERLQTQMSRAGLHLRFAPDLEKEYTADRASGCAQQARAGLSLGMVLLTVFFVLDIHVLGRHYPGWLVQIYLLGVIPMLALVLLVSRWPRLMPYTVHMTCTAMAITGIVFGTTAAQLIITPDRPPFGFESMVIYIAFIYFFSGATFHTSLGIALAATTLFVVGLLWSTVVPTVAIYCLFFLISINLVGIAGRYMLDKAYRRNYLTRMLATELAERDPLTGVHNRRVFEDRLDVLLRQAQREDRSITLLALDVDHFKAINDSGGHALGDTALRHLAAALETLARRPLDTVARLGGDEFAVLWIGLPYGEINERVHALSEDFARRAAPLASISGKPPTISIGVAHAEAVQFISPENLMHAADGALYRAKSLGRAQAVVDVLSVSSGEKLAA
ncbi:MAG: GGDEF domain-containing protein [Pseudomonadota bacterium]